MSVADAIKVLSEKDVLLAIQGKDVVEVPVGPRETLIQRLRSLPEQFETAYWATGSN